MFNKLLQRQISKFLEGKELSPDCMSFLQAVSDSYDHYEEDRRMLERSIDLTSDDMIELNNDLRKESEEVKKVNAELQKTNAELDKFVYSVSHDLRAPLTSMLGVLEIAKDISEDKSVTEHLDMIERSIERLDNFIIDILHYSRNSRMVLMKEEIHFDILLKDIVDNIKFMDRKTNPVKISTMVNNGLPFYSDKYRINVILNNIVSNAIRYQNPEYREPQVKINVSVSKDQAVIQVTDNGIGISEENSSKIFDMFYRVSDNSIGSGLGLYIVKETLEKLNGTVQVESELGKGTSFTIVIPNSSS